MAKNVESLYARPGMYLAVYDKKLDAASIYINFLFAVFDLLEFGSPNHVDITTSRQSFSVFASGCGLNIQNIKSESLTSVFDVANFQKPMLEKSYPSFIYLRPIVWFTEYCLVDITTQNGTYRQAFMNGSPLGEALQLPLEAARFGFHFTLPAKTFDSQVLDLCRLKQAISFWKEQDAVRASPVRKSTLNVHLQWCEQSMYHHTLRISNHKCQQTSEPVIRAWDNVKAQV